MISSINPELIFILGLPYSGSTLLALALGNSDEIVNCGEMNYIENDYYEGRVCSCGKTVVECSFWSKIASSLEVKKIRGEPVLNLSARQKLHPLDARNQTARRRLAMYLGLPLNRIFPESVLREYATNHCNFVNDVALQTGARYVVDASKSSRRLETILKYSDMPVRVIFLHRRPEDAFAGRLKRARRRNKHYHTALSPFYMGQMLHHLRNIRRIRGRLRPEQWIDLSYEKFLNEPEAEESRLTEWLDSPVEFNINENRNMEMRSQHVITGNIWLTRRHNLDEPIELANPPERPDLTNFEHTVFRFASRMFDGMSAT